MKVLFLKYSCNKEKLRERLEFGNVGMSMSIFEEIFYLVDRIGEDRTGNTYPV